MALEYDIPSRVVAKRLLVIGSPRSGTHFLTTVLNKFGLRVRHERMGEDGTVNCAWLALKRKVDPLIRVTGRQHYEFDQIVHLIRHPYATISSLAVEMHDPFWLWQLPHTKIEVDPSDMSTIADFWMFWTDGCTKLADTTIRLEDIAHLGEVVSKGIYPHLALDASCFSEEINEALGRRMERYGYKP
jgi:hypothetical protein